MAKSGGIARRGVLAVVGVVATLLAGPGAVAPASAAPVGPFPSEVAFVQQAYRDFAGREPTAEEVWAGVAAVSAGGTAPQELLADLLVSPPTRGVVFPVFRLYEAYFGRGPDAAGLAYWVRTIRSGVPTAVASDAFASSAEFTNRYGSLGNAAFVDLVYRNVLGRAPDAAGAAHWTGVLDRRQAHRGQVMLGFSDSSEYAQKLKHVVRVAAAYFGMLGRVPTGAQYDRGVALLAGGAPLHQLTGSVMGTSAYNARIRALWPATPPPPPPPPPSNGAVINVYNDPHHQLGIRDVLPFSTAKQDPTPPKRVRVKNVGTQTLVVSNVSVVGSSAFQIVNSATSFSLAPNQETQVQVEFRPPAIPGTRKGEQHIASLFFDSNDASQPRDEVFLRGWHMADYENNKEPNRQEITDTIGFTTDLGRGLPRDDVTAGEEQRMSGYFRKAGGGPVLLYPLARFSTRTVGATGNTRWFPQGTTPTPNTWQEIYKFPGCAQCTEPVLEGPGGENQKLVPTPDRAVSFNPTGNFGIGVRASGENLWSVDGFNGTGAAHTFRFWPARDRDRSIIPNTWIVGVDLGSSPDALPTKNWDYQDFMYVLSNAAPV